VLNTLLQRRRLGEIVWEDFTVHVDREDEQRVVARLPAAPTTSATPAAAAATAITAAPATSPTPAAAAAAADVLAAATPDAAAAAVADDGTNSTAAAAAAPSLYSAALQPSWSPRLYWASAATVDGRYSTLICTCICTRMGPPLPSCFARSPLPKVTLLMPSPPH